MYIYNQQQSTFRGGEVGEGISEQRGISPYYNTVEYAINCNVNNMGNVFRRSGFSFVASAPATDAFYHYDVLVWGFRKFDRILGNRRLVRRAAIFGENVADIYNITENGRLGALLCTINTPFSASVIQQTHYVSIERGVEDASVKAVLFTNRKIKPKFMLYKNEASEEADFSFQDVPLQNLPKHDFSNGSQKLTGTELGSGTVNIEQQHSQYVVRAQNPCFTTALADDYNGLVIKIKPIGALRIIRRVNDTTLDCLLMQDLGNTSNIAPADFVLYTGYEPIASDKRGWFECSAIFQNRLFFANTFDLPNALVGSTTQFKLDFDLGSLQDDDGVFTLIDTQLVDEVVKMQRGSSLLIFSKTQMFVLSSGANTVTPLNIGTTQISKGGGSDVYTQTPQTVEGGVLTIDSDVQKIFYITYDRSSETYLPMQLNSVLPKNLVKQSANTWSFIVINYGEDEGECAFFINSDMAIVRVMLTLDDEKQPACFTHYTFDNGIIPLKLFNIGKDLYCIFKEQDEQSLFIARMDKEAFLDYSFKAVPPPDQKDKVIVPEGCKIRNKEVYCIDRENGNLLQGYIDEDGILEVAANGHEVEFGLPFSLSILTHEIQGMPNAVPNLGGYKKVLNRLYLSVQEATTFRVGVSDNDPNSVIDYKTYIPKEHNVHYPYKKPIIAQDISGYYDECKIWIKQDLPGKFYLKNFTAQITAHTPFSA